MRESSKLKEEGWKGTKVKGEGKLIERRRSSVMEGEGRLRWGKERRY